MASKKDHLIVFVFSSLLFVTGVLSGITLSRIKINEVESRIETFEREINSLSLAVLINDALKNESLSCNFLKNKLNETQTQLQMLGEKAVDYEEGSKIKDEEYKNLKREYNSLRAQYWLMLEKLRNQCDNNYTTILFFYRTLTPCNECRDQGVVLAHIGANDPSVFVVPVDADEEDLIVQTIRTAFSVQETPSIIINAQKKLVGLTSEKEVLDNI